MRVPGLKALEQLRGAEVVDPPPAIAGIARLGAALPTCGGGGTGAGMSPLRRLGQEAGGTGTGTGTGTETGTEAGTGTEEDIDMEAEEAAPDDDPELGDIETYRRKRAEEAKLHPPEEDPDLDEGALAEAEAAAAAERALVAAGQAYEVESIRLKFQALRGLEADIQLEGRCAKIDAHGEVERSGIPFGGFLVARLEVA